MTKGIPPDYTPYRELEFCSNHFVNTPIPIEVEGHAPLLVGAGEGPHVWLSAPTKHDRKRWTFVVAANSPRVPDVRVEKPAQGVVEILAAGHKVLQVKETGPDVAAVTELDLRPLGFSIHGNTAMLRIGTNQFSGNRIENCSVAIGVGRRTR